MTSINSRRFLTVEEVAALVRLQPETVRQMSREGRLPGRKIGRVWRFDNLEIEAWLSTGPKADPQNADDDAAAVAVDHVAEQQVMELYGKGTAENGNGFKDPAFTENRNQAVHRWVPWIAGFSSQFVRGCFDRYCPSDKDIPTITVLDPFAGVGTTLVEAVRRGYAAYGFEINPYAALVTRAKLECCEISPDSLQRCRDSLVQHMANTVRDGSMPPEDVRPAHFRSRIPFYSASIEQQVLHALGFIRAIEDKAIRDLFLVAFGAVMVRFSNYSYEPSLASRPGSGKPLVENADVAAILAAKLRDIIADVRTLQMETGVKKAASRAKVFGDSIFRWDMYMDGDSVDLVVTSPPYLNNYHYIRNTRPHLFWLQLVQDTSQMKLIEVESFGKFWQTVRDAPPIALAFDMPDLQTMLEQLRGINTEKKSYGGAGWANYAATYFNDTYRFCKTLRRLLRPGGRAVIVIGNSILQGIEVKTDSFLARIGELCGLHCEAIHPLRDKRVGNSIIGSEARTAPEGKKRARLYEVAVVLRRPL